LEYRKLGNLEVSAIGMGTLRTFDVTSEEDIVVRQEIVDSCIANQVNFIDTAA
jgi:aryl-alcohol dehydrogenase-like predicted oxidoreductase